MTRVVETICLLAILILGSGATPPATDEDERAVTALNADVEDLIAEGRFAEALVPAERALELGETSVDTDPLEAAAACLNLARICRATKQYDRAHALYERTSEIWQEAWGAQHPRLILPLLERARLYRAQRDYANAVAFYERVLRMQELILGPQYLGIATTLDAIAGIYQLQQDYGRTEEFLLRALEIREQALGPDHPEVARSLNYLAGIYQITGDRERAKPLLDRYEEAVQNAELMRQVTEQAGETKGWGDTPPRPDPERGSIGLTGAALRARGRRFSPLISPKIRQVYFVKTDEDLELYAAGEFLWSNYSRAERAYLLRGASNVVSTNYSRNGQFYLLNAEPGRYVLVGATVSVGVPSLTINLNTATTSSQVRVVPYHGVLSLGDFARTEVLLRPGEMTFLGELILVPRGKADEALPHYGELIAQVARQERSKKGFLAKLLAGSGRSLRGPMELEQIAADTVTERAFWRKARQGVFETDAWLGFVRDQPDAASGYRGPRVDAGLFNELLIRQPTDDDVRFAERAVQLAERTLGAAHPQVAALLNDLGDAYLALPDYARPEPLYRRALDIRREALGPQHPSVGHSLRSLARLQLLRQDHDEALALYEQALEVWEGTLQPDRPEVIDTFLRMGDIRMTQGLYARAEQDYERALKIGEKSLGQEHPDCARSLDKLAQSHQARGDHATAEELYRRALNIREEALGPKHADVAESLDSLAWLHHARGEDPQAVPLLERALEVTEKTTGRKSPATAKALTNLALFYDQEDRQKEALDLLERAGENREREFKLLLAAGSEEQKLAFSERFAHELQLVLTHHLLSAPQDPDAASLAFTTILRRKGRVLDATAASLTSLRARLEPADQAVLWRLNALRAELAAMTLGGPQGMPVSEFEGQVSKLEAQMERVEAELSDRSAEFRTQSKPIVLKRVQAELPKDAALVEFVSYRPYRFEEERIEDRLGSPRYVAYVLTGKETPRAVELGDAAEIDLSIAALRRSSARPDQAEFEEDARGLYETVLRPVLPLLGEARHLLLAPDGALNLVPFASLIDENGRYVVSRFAITYLNSGRELPRLSEPSSPREGSWVIAAPDFDASDAGGTKPEAAPLSQARRSREFSGILFSPLPGTQGEAQALGALLPGASVRTGNAATEKLIKELHGPQVLHIATHGFFLEDQAQPLMDQRGLALVDSGASPGAAVPSSIARIENPLLRSGLALAGANNPRDEGEDGVLTALEASGLDLWGTQLVVLSACETGVGDVRTGEGVFGLRRALVMAGSESQVMSLWKVADEATRDLMVAYYTRLKAGEGRSEALRQVQLEMLADEDLRHPYYWAGFIQSGDWRPILLTGKKGRRKR